MSTEKRHVLTFSGYVIDAGQDGTAVRRTLITPTRGDYGADPLPDGTFRMVPSGDIVSFDERCKRLKRVV